MERKFLHTLDPEKDSKGPCQTYEIAGVVWTGFACSTWDWLNYRINDNTKLEIELEPQKNMFLWRYRMELSESVYFESRGHAPSIELACQEAFAYVPETVTLDYLGRSFIWYVQKRDDSINWISCIDGDKAAVEGHYGDDHYFTWERHWEPAKSVLELSSRYFHELEGKKPTLQEAFIAAIDAPNVFTRACGKFVSSLKPNQLLF